MNVVTPDAVRAFVAEVLAHRLDLKGMTTTGLDDEIDLLRDGIIDSLGLLELITSIEDRYGISMDLDGADTEQFTRIGTFCRFVAQRCATPS